MQPTGKEKDEVRGATGVPGTLCHELDLICCLGIWDVCLSLKQSNSCGTEFKGPFQRGPGYDSHLGQGQPSFSSPFLNPHRSQDIFLLRKSRLWGAHVIIAGTADHWTGREGKVAQQVGGSAVVACDSSPVGGHQLSHHPSRLLPSASHHPLGSGIHPSSSGASVL